MTDASPSPLVNTPADAQVSLADLIARLEKATGPDRELDALIYCLDNDYQFVRFERWNDRAGRAIFQIPGMKPLTESDGFPRFTGSIDAAALLRPSPRWFWRVDSHDPSAWVYLNIQDAFKGSGKTPAISLCIAALKARAR